MAKKPKIGDRIYWWVDDDPGNPEVGPQPDIDVATGKVLEIIPELNGNRYKVIRDGFDEPTVIMHAWIASDEDLKMIFS